MSLRAVILVTLVAAPAALAAGYFQGLRAPEPEAGRVRRPVAPFVEKPGQGAGEAAAYLARLNAPPPPPRRRRRRRRFQPTWRCCSGGTFRWCSIPPRRRRRWSWAARAAR